MAAGPGRSMSSATRAMPQFRDALVSVGLIVSRVATAMLDGISLSSLRWKSGRTTGRRGEVGVRHALAEHAQAQGGRRESRRCRRRAGRSARALEAGFSRECFYAHASTSGASTSSEGAPRSSCRGERETGQLAGEGRRDIQYRRMSGAEPGPRRERRGEGPVPAQFTGHVRARHEARPAVRGCRPGATARQPALAQDDQAVGHRAPRRGPASALSWRPWGMRAAACRPRPAAAPRGPRPSSRRRPPRLSPVARPPDSQLREDERRATDPARGGDQRRRASGDTSRGMERGSSPRAGGPERRVLHQYRSGQQVEPRPQDPGCGAVARRADASGK